MSETSRLYFADPFLSRFEGRVVAHGTWAGAPSLILAETAFYPEAGGQMADRGTLGGLGIADVQVDDHGVVHHVLDGALPEVGAVVTGEIDRVRRRLHMAQHTGQHMLSRAFVDEIRGETVSSRLGENACTIDLDLEKVDEGALARAEALVNSIVDDDVTIRAWFPEAAELAGLPLRRTPKVDRDIRVVSIGEFDVSPCGGTHCTRSGQVGFVRITGLERYKGKVRVTFAAGRRAREELSAQAEALGVLARDFTCGPLEVGRAVDKLRRELASAREALGVARTRLAGTTAAELLAAAESQPLPDGSLQVVSLWDDADLEFVRAVAKHVTARPNAVAILAAREADGLRVHVSRGATASFDCGAFLKRVAAAAGGRGGGRPDRAEGTLPADFAWPPR